MKYNCAILLLTLTTALHAQETTKRGPVTLHLSVNTRQSSSNVVKQEQPHSTYRVIPSTQQPVYQPTTPLPPSSSLATGASLQPESINNAPSLSSQDLAPSLHEPISQSPSLLQIPSITEFMTSLRNTFCSLNPITLAAGTISVLYVAYLTKLYIAAYHVIKKNNWSTWKEHIPLEVMQEVPAEEVAEQLFIAIKSKYTPLNSADLMTPLVKFNNAVDQEIAALNHFLQLHDWLHYAKLSYIFPHQEIEIMLAQTKIKRLLFLKDVLLAWMNTYSSAIMQDKFIPYFQQQSDTKQQTQNNAPSPTECLERAQ